MTENCIVFIDANGAITGQIHSYDPNDEIEIRRLIEDFKHSKPAMKESLGEPPQTGGSEGFLSPQELRQGCVDWILKNEAQAREHAQPLREFLGGTHLNGSLGHAEANGISINYNLAAPCPKLREAFMQPSLREYRATQILDSAKRWFIEIRDDVLGYEFHKILGIPGGQKLRVKTD